MKYSLRFVWYVLRIVIVGLAAFAVLVATFFIAMDSSNVYVIVTDGMKARVTAALVPSQASSADISNYFTDHFTKTQPAVDTAKYTTYAITGIKYKLDVESLWCNPWANTANVTVVESIPEMTYTPAQDVPEGKESPEPPRWPRIRYKINCVKRDDAWRIDSIEKIETLTPEPTPTPEPSKYITASPLPTTAAPTSSPLSDETAAPSPAPSAT